MDVSHISGIVGLAVQSLNILFSAYKFVRQPVLYYFCLLVSMLGISSYTTMAYLTLDAPFSLDDFVQGGRLEYIIYALSVTLFIVLIHRKFQIIKSIAPYSIIWDRVFHAIIGTSCAMCLIFTQIPALARIQSLRYLGSGVLITAVFVSSSAFGFVFHRNLKKIEDQMKEISRRRSSSDATSIVLLWLKMVIISIMLMSFFCIVVYFALLGLYLGGILDFDGFLQATTAIQLAGVPLYFGGCLGFLETIYISVENLFCYGDGAVPTIKSTYGLTTTKHATTVIQSQVAEKPEHNSADSGLIP